MTSWGDKVEESVDPVVAEAGVTLDTRLFSENVIVLSLNVTGDFTKPRRGASFIFSKSSVHTKETADARKFVVDVITETRSVDNSQRDADAIFFELCVRAKEVSVPPHQSNGMRSRKDGY